MITRAWQALKAGSSDKAAGPFLIVGWVASMAVACSNFAVAAGPERPVRLVVPFSAGGSVDIVARVLARKVTPIWNQQVVIDNRNGAGSTLGTALVAKAAPDGYTLLINSPAIVIAPGVYKQITFDPVKDFAPITKIGFIPCLLLVSPKIPVNTVAELIALAKSRPGKMSYASPGIGSSFHLATAIFNQMANIEAVHVPYKGGSSAMPDLISGKPEFMFNGIVETLPMVRTGRIKALGISTAQRSEQAPDIPSVAESGLPGYDFAIWHGLFAPAKTAPAVVSQYNRDFVRILREPETIDQLRTLGMAIAATTSEQFAAEMEGEVQRWGNMVKAAGIQQE